VVDIAILILLGILVVSAVGASSSLRRIAELNSRYVGEAVDGTTFMAMPGSEIYISAFGFVQRCTVLGMTDDGALIVAPDGPNEEVAEPSDPPQQPADFGPPGHT